MTKNNILWSKVWAIAAVQGAITLTYIVYNLYLPALIFELRLSTSLATTILIVEHALAAFIKPVFGYLSDRQQRRFGTRIRMIVIAAILASAFLIIVPVLVILGEINPIWRRLFPTIAISWAVTTAICYVPTIALLRSCAPPEKLAQAASVLTLVVTIISALQFDVHNLILKLGESFTFTISSISLLAAVALIRWLYPPQRAMINNHELESIYLPIFALIFTIGLGIAWGIRFLTPTLNNVFSLQIGQDHSRLAIMIFFIALGLAAFPAGKLATKLGNSFGMLVGLAVTIFCLQLLILVPNQIILGMILIILIFALSLVLNSSVPFVFSLVLHQDTGLGTGLYFGGLAAGISCFNVVFPQPQQITINIGAIGTTVSFLLALLAIAFSMQLKIQED
ncbi:major facilitator superfamily MFS_1 [Stanieria cyanosphaera PCC 7437]|uniref:Major facilitator superfamily MFS_1 n=1 Tax=Stanieria cyanosphaera (strain ATCC 29371 / PCC 7437) TaxID=111780 RepID=K9XZ07_STAC7|nr:MFS transporter [Stanieria cyanosphaera]AFZ37835.1 major facilitator superfamily MFS_1 [Stanieria cyanosphaera PCC 7437]